MNNGYINQREMIRHRKEIMQESNYKCKICGGVATKIHHIDFSKINHAKENLMPVCDKCHSKLHEGANRSNGPKINTHKINYLMALNGYSKKAFAEKMNMSASTLSIILKKQSTKNSTIKRMAEIFNCEVQDILTDEYMEQIEKTGEKHYPDGLHTRFQVRDTQEELEKLDKAIKKLGYKDRADWYRDCKRQAIRQAESSK